MIIIKGNILSWFKSIRSKNIITDLNLDQPNRPETRYRWLDGLRGLAVILMIVFHFFYDLSYFGFISDNVAGKSIWLPLRYLIISIFVLTMGMSLYFSSYKGIKLNAFIKRTGNLIILSASITIGTYIFIPDKWVYFGILHFLVFASIFGVIFINIPYVALALGISILLIHKFVGLSFGWPMHNFKPYDGPPMDFVPLTPWLGVALIGIFLGFYVVSSRRAQAFLNKVNPSESLVFTGKHALTIYVLHQAILFPAIYFFSYVYAIKN